MKKIIAFIALFGTLAGSIPHVGYAQTQARLVKCPNEPAVYLINEFQRAKRFTDEQTFYSYGYQFSQVEIVRCEPNLPYVQDGDAINRHGFGFRLMKKINDPRVFQCPQNKTCTHITSEQEAVHLFGSTWTRQIYETPEGQPEQKQVIPTTSIEVPVIQPVVIKNLNQDPMTPVTVTSPQPTVTVTAPVPVTPINTPSVAIKKSYIGRVTDAQTGEPIAGATVALAYSSVFTTSDKDGYYRLPSTNGEVYVVADWYEPSQTKTLDPNDHNDFSIKPIELPEKTKMVHLTAQWGEKKTSVLSSLSGTITNKNTGELIPVKLVFENRSEPQGKIANGIYDVKLKTGIYRTYLVTSDETLQARLPNERYLFSVPAGYVGTMNLQIELK